MAGLEAQMGTEAMLRDMVAMEEHRRITAEAKLEAVRALCDEADEHGTDTGVIDTVDIRAVLDGSA